MVSKRSCSQEDRQEENKGCKPYKVSKAALPTRLMEKSPSKVQDMTICDQEGMDESMAEDPRSQSVL